MAEMSLERFEPFWWPIPDSSAELHVSPKTPKPPKQTFCSPNWNKEELQPLRNKPPKQVHDFHDISVTKIALLVAGEVSEYGRCA